MIGYSDSIAAILQLEHGTSSRPRRIMFGFRGRLKWSTLINYCVRSHILLASGTHLNLLLPLQFHLRIGHPSTQTTLHPLPTLTTPTSLLLAPPLSSPTIFHLLLIPFLSSPFIQQLLSGMGMILLPSNQTVPLGLIISAHGCRKAIQIGGALARPG